MVICIQFKYPVTVIETQFPITAEPMQNEVSAAFVTPPDESKTTAICQVDLSYIKMCNTTEMIVIFFFFFFCGTLIEVHFDWLGYKLGLQNSACCSP